MEPHLLEARGMWVAATLKEAYISVILHSCHKCLSYHT